MGKYCKGKGNRGGKNLSELHTMMISTVMIRRKKNDILKTLPPKVRRRVIVSIMDEKLREQFKEMMIMLRKSTGQLGKLAVRHRNEILEVEDEKEKKVEDLTIEGDSPEIIIEKEGSEKQEGKKSSELDVSNEALIVDASKAVIEQVQ